MNMQAEPLIGTNLPLPNKRAGKVRDLYDLTLPDGGEGLLIVATDRISVFDVVLASGIPGKGRLLTQLSTFWFDLLADVLAAGNACHHLVATDLAAVPSLDEMLDEQQKNQLQGRIMICRKTRVLPVECIVRGYITGSGFKEYLARGEVCGIPLPAGLQNSDRLAEPIFTPSTKATEGHDENITLVAAAAILGKEAELAVKNQPAGNSAPMIQPAADSTFRAQPKAHSALTQPKANSAARTQPEPDYFSATNGQAILGAVKQVSESIYAHARDYADDLGIIIADTKMEFGLDAEGQLVLIDELLTPDSSRFWPKDVWTPGKEQDSLDKQFVRNYTETLVAAGKWNKDYPAPTLPDDIITSTQARYAEVVSRLTGAG